MVNYFKQNTPFVRVVLPLIKVRPLFLFILISMMAVGAAYSQQLKLLDTHTNKPISDVAIYSSDNQLMVITNNEGMADLSVFNDSALLHFRHPSYQEVSMLKSDVPLEFKLTEKVIKMGELVISANKWEQDASEIPNQIVGVDIEQVYYQNPPTAAELLENTGQVFVQKSQQGGGSPMIRGFSANAVLIMLDGVRLNNAIFRGGNLHNVTSIDPSLLQSAEVLFGPGSVIYGSDAMGGVLDFHTSESELKGDKFSLHNAHSFARVSSANRELSFGAKVDAGNKKWGILAGFTRSQFGDLTAGSWRTNKYPDFGKRPEYQQTIDGVDMITPNNNVNRQVASGYAQYNGLLKLKYRPIDWVLLHYNLNISANAMTPRYDRLIEYNGEVLKYAEWYYGPQNHIMNAVKLQLFNTNPLYDEAKLIVARQDFRENRTDRRFGNNIRTSRDEYVDLYSINADFDKGLSKSSELFYGAELTHNIVDSKAVSTNILTNEEQESSTRYPSGGSTYTTLAGYVTSKIRFNTQWVFDAGIRYTFTSLNSEFKEQTFPFQTISMQNDAVNGNLGVVWKSSGWKFSQMFSTGFRAPNIDDVAKVFDSEPGNVVVPNPDLKPEYVYNTETSLHKTIENVLHIQGTFFYSWLNQAMVRRNFTWNGQDSIMYDGTLSRVQAIVNANHAYVYGLSFHATAMISRNVDVEANYNWQEGRDTSEDLPLRHTSPTFYRVGLNYRWSGLKTTLFMAGNGPRSWDELPPSEQNKPHMYTPDGSLAWWTLNLNAEWFSGKGWTVQAGVRNILDKHYRPYSSGISAPGRDFYLTLRYSYQ